jgi:hypothetical protein
MGSEWSGVEDRAASTASVGGAGGVGFLGALVAVFLAGAVGGSLASLLSVYGLLWGETGTILLTTFAGILIGAVAIKVVLGFMDADVSLTVAVVTMIIGNLLPLVIVSARLRSEAHVAGHNSPVLPFVGVGFNAISGLLGIAILLGQALIVQNFSTA